MTEHMSGLEAEQQSRPSSLPGWEVRGNVCYIYSPVSWFPGDTSCSIGVTAPNESSGLPGCFTGFSPNSGNDLAVTLLPCTLRGQTEDCTDSANLSKTEDKKKSDFPHAGVIVSITVW